MEIPVHQRSVDKIYMNVHFWLNGVDEQRKKERKLDVLQINQDNDNEQKHTTGVL